MSVEDDAALDEWMQRSLQIAVWEKPLSCLDLGAVEFGVIKRWSPALNIRDNESPWRQITLARRRMAADARAWRLR